MLNVLLLPRHGLFRVNMWQVDIYFLLLSLKPLLYFPSLIFHSHSHPTFLLDECLQSSHPCPTVGTGHGHQIQ